MFIEDDQFHRVVKLMEEYEALGNRISRTFHKQIYRCLRTDSRQARKQNEGLPWMSEPFYSDKNEMERELTPDDSCEDCVLIEDFCLLMDHLVKDILHLEEETVRWRKAASRYLEPHDAENLMQDIYDGLAERHTYDDAYQHYLRYMGYEKDPMESEEHRKALNRIKLGKDDEIIPLFKKYRESMIR